MRKYFYILYIWATILLCIHLFLLLNLQFTAWPEMASFPYLFSKGFVLYKDFVHPYPPLLTLTLSAVYKVFGYKLLVLKIFTWTTVLLNDVLILLIVRNVTKSGLLALVSVLLYVITQPFLDGNMLWFDTAIVTPILLATYFAAKYFDNNLNSIKNLLFSGIFFGAALLTKQTVVAFIAAFVFLIVFLQKKLKNVLFFLAPIGVIIGILVLGLVGTGGLSHFLNWNFIYPSSIWTSFPGYVMLVVTRGDLFKLLLVLLPALLLVTFAFKEVWLNKLNLLLYLFLIAGVVSVYPRFSFFHFQTALAFAVILFGIFIQKIRLSSFYIFIYFLLIAKFISIPSLNLNWHKETRFWSHAETKFAEIITSKVGEDSFYLLGPHSIYYVLAGNTPPKPWLDNFGWFFEVPGVQEDVIYLWQKNPPKAIFIQDAGMGNWYDIGTYQPKQILSWVETNYTRQEEVVPGVWFWRLKNK